MPVAWCLGLSGKCKCDLPLGADHEGSYRLLHGIMVAHSQTTVKFDFVKNEKGEEEEKGREVFIWHHLKQ